MVHRFLVVICLTLLSNALIFGQIKSFDEVVKLSWSNNQMLNAKEFDLQSAVSSWQEAKSMFGPTATFGVQYSLASGGRSIDFPIGDLMNPVYGTLNKLTNTNSFPTIENEKINFLPNNFYDSKVRISQAIYYPDLVINKKLKNETIMMKQLELKAYKRLLSRDVMNVYFQLQSTQKAIEIYANAQNLLKEAKRSTESLIKNGVGLPSALSRIESQIATIHAQQIEAEANHQNVLSYYTFLTGNDDLIDVDLPEMPEENIVLAAEREELTQLTHGIKMQKLGIDKEDKFYVPKVGFQIDLGSQAFNFGFVPYVLAGLNVEMNLFDNKKHNYKKQALEADVMASESKQSFVAQQIQLQTKIAFNNLHSTIDQAKTFQPRIAAVDKIYKEIFTKYKEGVANYLELIDAQTQVTQVNIQYILLQQEAWTKWAEYIYASAAYPIL